MRLLVVGGSAGANGPSRRAADNVIPSGSFPTFTEAIGMAAQKICREIGAGLFPLVWSELGPEAIEGESS